MGELIATCSLLQPFLSEVFVVVWLSRGVRYLWGPEGVASSDVQ